MIIIITVIRPFSFSRKSTVPLARIEAEDMLIMAIIGPYAF